MIEPLQTEDTDSDAEGHPYILHLFVTGASLHSTRAITNIKHICESYLPGNYSLEIIDVYQQKALAEREQLIALPLLIRRMPLPERRLVGDLSDTEKVLNGLGISRL
ncbi:circadian clock protein KaiB [Spirosoma sp. HMF3257]|uniref:Circadian clock protein KaiB n=1 Tax=Spirosoma telluris TaxID=2183553 RepID=A0A327NLV4_9BACT|nr:circadian clock protein KaiB [Spirosoma telluris]RAI76147.1 circadian clock protein KaiB [Spirosoma telluris]